MPVKDDLGQRMKEYYENVPKTKLMRRMPVAIRIDGKCFHSFTKGFEKPFDEVLAKTMQDTMKYLCQNIQNCVFGYTQSDEITLILVDYKNLDSSAWFDNEVQKMCSIAASMATMTFNKFFIKNTDSWFLLTPDNNETHSLGLAYGKSLETGAMFDARCFNIPKEEVANLIYWRQLDATRNSIQMVGHANFSDKELHKKTCSDIQDMLQEKGINWNDFATYLKRGSACLYGEHGWYIDYDMPIIKGEDRAYVENLIFV